MVARPRLTGVKLSIQSGLDVGEQCAQRGSVLCLLCPRVRPAAQHLDLVEQPCLGFDGVAPRARQPPSIPPVGEGGDPAIGSGVVADEVIGETLTPRGPLRCESSHHGRERSGVWATGRPADVVRVDRERAQVDEFFLGRLSVGRDDGGQVHAHLLRQENPYPGRSYPYRVVALGFRELHHATADRPEVDGTCVRRW